MEGGQNWKPVKGFFDGLKPNERMTVDAWADKYRVLTSVSSSEPGSWRTDRVPYTREIMWQLSGDSPAKEVIVMKGAQLAFTEIGLNWIGYIIDITPGPTLVVMGTEDALKKNTRTRIDPMLLGSERLRDKLPPPSSKSGGNNMFEKYFAGGALLMATGNSATALRSMPIRFLFLDEVDSYPADLDGEGSPVALAEARTSNFPNKKIYKISTPTIKGQSLIEKEYETTDKRKYFVPCPHCGAEQELRWEQIRWELGTGGLPAKVWYECEHCRDHIHEHHKTDMLACGTWRATNTKLDNPERIGYHISSLYSPYGWYSWRDMVGEFLRAQSDSVKMKTFYNTRLGLPYAVSGISPKWETLRNRAESYKPNQPPKGVVFLTAGVDVQRDRLELEIVGWGRDKRSWSIDYRTLMGDTANTEVWDKLAWILDEAWTREDGTQLKIMKMAVDSGDYTQHVYNFVRRFDETRVVAIKGQASKSSIWSRPSAVDVNAQGVKVGTLNLYTVGVNILKSELYTYLQLEKDEHGNAPHGYCFFPDAYPAEYFKGIASEQLQEQKNTRGYDTLQWVKIYRRNEPLDCRNYARAAASMLLYDNFTERDFAALESSYIGIARPTQAQTQQKRSSFWE